MGTSLAKDTYGKTVMKVQQFFQWCE